MLNYTLKSCWALLVTLAFSIIFQVAEKTHSLHLAGGIGWVVLSVALHHFRYSSVTSSLLLCRSPFMQKLQQKMKTIVTTTLILGLSLGSWKRYLFYHGQFRTRKLAAVVDLGRETLFVTAAMIGIVFITSISQIIIRILKYKTILQKYQHHHKAHKHKIIKGSSHLRRPFFFKI